MPPKPSRNEVKGRGGTAEMPLVISSGAVRNDGRCQEESMEIRHEKNMIVVQIMARIIADCLNGLILFLIGRSFFILFFLSQNMSHIITDEITWINSRNQPILMEWYKVNPTAKRTKPMLGLFAIAARVWLFFAVVAPIGKPQRKPASMG